MPVPFQNLLGSLVLALAGTGAAVAQEPRQSISLELNAMRPGQGGCLLSFVAQNDLNRPTGKLVLETVLFTTDGQVAQLTLLDFGALPVAVPRVRQFEFAGLGCDAIGRVLINGTQICETTDGAPCDAGLTLSSRTRAELIG